MRRCPPATLLDRYAAGALPGPDADLVESHLVGCAACADRLERLGMAQDLLEQLRDAESARAELGSDLAALSSLQQWFTTTLSSVAGRGGPWMEHE
ncbi:MAG TPA: zf-HC2 domain-containing protein [Phycisphaerae bacterium]|nr:zf-HC2 domain-containing protein [Phycisphaerae bacterium]